LASPRFSPVIRRIICVLGLASWAWCAPQNYCAPASEMQVEFQSAMAQVGSDAADFERNVAPFRNIRKKYPQDLFAHERYQDAVRQHGIEGHLRTLVAEYQALQAENPGDWKYEYLLHRALLGRNTKATTLAVESLSEQHPEFAPAHRLLAEMYSTEAFHDMEKEQAEVHQLRELCPDNAVTEHLDALPDSSALVGEAGRLMESSGNPEEAVKLAEQGIRADEWRLQRIRPFDWYSVAFKREQQYELQKEYWRAWGIQVWGYRKTQQQEKAEALLHTMEERATFLNVEADSVRWEALVTLARLYEEGKQQARAAEKLRSMQEILAKSPDAERSAQVEEIKRKLNEPAN
jgi:hypothetical protein